MWETIVIQPFTNVLLLINSLVHNFGVSIILFTMLIRLLTHPLTVKQYKSTQALQALQTNPRYQKMQKKYANDKDRLAQEQMKLYKELGINPMGSCLPTIIQLPIIFGLYQSVTKAMAASPKELFDLQQLIYPWLVKAENVLPLENRFLWMDLGQPERLNVFGIALPILAILVVATTFLQSKLIQPPSSADDQAAMVTKSMNIYMPVLMGFMAYSLASGLALYFLASNIFGIVQYAILGRANWSNIFPFLKGKEKTDQVKEKPEVIDAKVDEVLESIDEELEEEPETETRTLPKRIRPKRKKNR